MEGDTFSELHLSSGLPVFAEKPSWIFSVAATAACWAGPT